MSSDPGADRHLAGSVPALGVDRALLAFG
jgi:hypothetical protein